MEAVDAEVASVETAPARRARITHRRRRNWIMFDPYLWPLQHGDSTDRHALTEGTTSAGEKVVVGFRAAEPPKISHIFYKLHLLNQEEEIGSCLNQYNSNKKRPSVWLREARAVAADGDCILLCFFIVDGSNSESRRVMREEFFIYRAASTSALTKLPRSSFESIYYGLSSKIGILCYNDGEFVVAHLAVTAKFRSGKRRVSIDLCCMSSKDPHWRTTKSVPILNAEGHDHLIWWETDTVVASGRQHLCFVDYLRGVLFYDVLNPFPHLYYAPLPLDPYLTSIDRDAQARGPLSAYRSVCVTKDGLKFVDVENNRCWFYPHHWHVPYAVSTWTMSMHKPNDYEWVKDGCMEVDELAAITKQHKLPSSLLRFPLVDREKPELIYFALEDKDTAFYVGNPYLVIFDMKTKVLADVICYTRADFTSLQDYVYNDTLCCNLSTYTEFLPCEFSDHLDQDEPHGSDEDVARGMFYGGPESSMLLPPSVDPIGTQIMMKSKHRADSQGFGVLDNLVLRSRQSSSTRPTSSSPAIGPSSSGSATSYVTPAMGDDLKTTIENLTKAIQTLQTTIEANTKAIQALSINPSVAQDSCI